MLSSFIVSGKISANEVRKIKQWHEEDRSTLIGEMIKSVQTEVIKFPRLRDRIQNPKQLFENLKKYWIHFSYNNVFFYKNIQWKDKTYCKIKYRNKQFVSFETQPDDYENIDCLVDYFNEIPRLSARRNHKSFSPLEAWSNPDKFRRWIETRIENEQDISILEWREYLWKSSLECNAFKSTLAFSMYNSFKSKRVLDFSSGWGDRLLAAIAYNVEKYTGYDPNPRLYAGYQEMIDMFVPPTEKHRFVLCQEPFETAVLDPDEMYDFVFTSPPYYNFEIYLQPQMDESSTQSIARYPDFEQWIVNFLFCSLQKAWNQLSAKGNMVIHLADVNSAHCVEAMTLFVLGWCKNSRFDGSMASIGDSNKPRPLWIYYKTTDTTGIVDQAAQISMQTNYPEIFAYIEEKGFEI